MACELAHISSQRWFWFIWSDIWSALVQRGISVCKWCAGSRQPLRLVLYTDSSSSTSLSAQNDDHHWIHVCYSQWFLLIVCVVNVFYLVPVNANDNSSLKICIYLLIHPSVCWFCCLGDADVWPVKYTAMTIPRSLLLGITITRSNSRKWAD